LAQSQFCLSPKDALPCQKCRNCQLIAANDFSDVQVIHPTGNTIKIEQIRAMIAELAQTGIEGEKRVFILQSIELLSQGAANALLKFIEEPQSNVYFFFITNQIGQVLPTVRSRTQIIHFEKNKQFLAENLKKSDILPSKADLLAEITNDFTDAVALSEQSWFNNGEQVIKQWVADLFSGKSEVFVEVGANFVAIFDDKAKQKLAFKLIAFYIDKKMHSTKRYFIGTAFFEIEQMFSANVSFQNCLEYLVIQSLWR
jgi:DNA polymerase-3 subunit delta'